MQVELVRHVSSQQPVLNSRSKFGFMRRHLATSKIRYKIKASGLFLQEVTILETTQMHLQNILSGIPEKVMAVALATTAPSNELRTILEGKSSAIFASSCCCDSCAFGLSRIVVLKFSDLQR